MSKGSRSRFSGSANDVATVISQFASGPGWLKYGPQVMPHVAAEHADLLKSLRGLSGNLAFTQGTVKQAMQIVVDECQWSIAREDASSFTEVMATRLRTMCRHVEQAHMKKVAWARKLLDGPADTQLDVGSSSESNRVVPAAEVFFYGYDYESKCAWRAEVGSASKEYTRKLMAEDETRVTDPMVAVWPCGHRAEIHDLTVGMWLKMKQPAGTEVTPPPSMGRRVTTRPRLRGKVSANSVWAGVHKKTSNVIFVRVDKDRFRLVRIHEQGRAVCQISETQVAMETAKLIMVDIARRYADDAIDAAALYEERNKELAKLGVALTAKRKRPAATPTIEGDADTEKPEADADAKEKVDPATDRQQESTASSSAAGAEDAEKSDLLVDPARVARIAVMAEVMGVPPPGSLMDWH